MGNSFNETTKKIVGIYPQALAFSVVRDLEHAGISTSLTALDNEYKVAVAESDWDRAIERV
jgi:hypothetical protein